MCSQQTLGQSSATLNQLAVCLHSHTYFQQPQKKGHCQGLERKLAVSEIYLPKQERTQWLGKGEQVKENIRNLRQKTISILVLLLQLDAKKKNPFIGYQHMLPSVTDFPLCYLSPQRTPGNPASSRAWCAMGHVWALNSSWAPLSPTAATVATH